jgi:hypothetical protein
MAVVLAAVATAVVLGVLLFSNGHPQHSSRAVGSMALLEGTASPCSPMSQLLSDPVTVRVFHGATVVARTELNPGRRPEFAQAYRFHFRVSPGRYLVTTTWNVHAEVTLTEGEVRNVSVDANYCK